MRMCIDYRRLNANTKVDRFPLPQINNIMDSLGGSAVYSTIDLKSAYHLVQIEPGHEYKTAF